MDSIKFLSSESVDNLSVLNIYIGKDKKSSIEYLSKIFNKHDCESLMLYYENLLPNKLLEKKQNHAGNTGEIKRFCGKIVTVEEYISEPQNIGMRYICMLNIRSVYEGVNDLLTIKKIAFRAYEPIERHSNFPLFKFNFKVNKSIIIKIALSVLLLIAIYMYVMNNRYIIKPPYRYDKWTNKAEYIHYDRRY